MSAQDQRPDSRASTTSATSQHDEFKQQAHPHPNHGTFMSGNPEAALLDYHAGIDGSQHLPQYDMAQQPSHMPHAHPRNPQFQPMPGYQLQDPVYMPHGLTYGNEIRPASVPIQSGTEGHDDKRRKGSAVTATNDKELREILARNEGRLLKDVAQEVTAKERTPMAEKTKQLFAMLWLRAVCKPAKTSVPRNRVYSQYASRCGTERVVPLNPASFGKLVRVIFPGIQTRRLGVRGESKYHYVDLALDEAAADSSVPYANSYMETRPRSQSYSTQRLDFNNIPNLQADTAAFPIGDGSFDYPAMHPPTPRGPPSQGQAFAYPDMRGMQPSTAESMTYPHTLRFPPSNLPIFTENEPVSLPPIQPYLPQKTDLDIADALFALYRTHCTSLIDSIRFCKEKQFYRLYTSFHGTLTVPVQKLFTHPNLAPWIEQCDLVMYRTMVRFVSRLTLQAAPVIVINILSNISTNLHSHIAKTFSSQPPHVLDAKLRPATVFARLLYRLIRVNQSAHAAANLLTIDQNREQMWREWSTMVSPKRVMEAELPSCGYDEVYKLLTSEMRTLLEPLASSSYNEDPYNFQLNFDEHGSFASYIQSQTVSHPGSRNGASAVSTENVLDRWSGFITALPARFPHASARTLLHCISVIGTSALRDITIMNGASYGHWWVLKIFVDEMALWLAEMGGFLDPDVAPAATANANGHSHNNATNGVMYRSPTLQPDGSEGHSAVASRGASLGAEAHQATNASQMSNGAANYAYPRPYEHGQGFSLPYAASAHAHLQRDAKFHEAGGQDVDDSGIGMEMMA